MKALKNPRSVLLIVSIVAIISCHKDRVGASDENLIAKVGPTEAITLPQDSILLDGRSSSGEIVKYSWSKISGPTSFLIENPASPLTIVSKLTEGTYVFRLTVSGNRSSTSSDKKIVVYPEPLPPPPPFTPIDSSFTEEFKNVYQLASKDWIITDHSSSYAQWTQGSNGCYKMGGCHGFSSYSYTAQPDEHVYAFVSSTSTNFHINSWLITPVLNVRNGDKISFYSRADTGTYTHRMQVLINKSSSSDVGGTNTSVGTFTTLLLDINEAEEPRVYPQTWTRYECTFSGIQDTLNTRVAFRYFLTNGRPRGIGVDLFKFERK